MNETAEMTALLEKMEQTALAQQQAARRQTLLMTVAAAACVGILILVGILFGQLQPVVAQLQDSTALLSYVTEELAAVDIAGTVQGLNDTVALAQEGLSDGLGKLEQLDIDTLNAAIADLARVVEPLSKFFGVFNR